MEDDKTIHPREDDRNEEIDKSPAPDPTEGERNPGDDPEAEKSAGGPATVVRTRQGVSVVVSRSNMGSV
jgi:hypothetical protein